MERLRIALVGALVLVIVGAAPALAQRDPFDSVDTSGNNSDSSSDSGGGPFSQPETGGSSDDTGDTSTDTGYTSGQDDPTQPDQQQMQSH